MVFFTDFELLWIPFYPCTRLFLVFEYPVERSCKARKHVGSNHFYLYKEEKGEEENFTTLKQRYFPFKSKKRNKPDFLLPFLHHRDNKLCVRTVWIHRVHGCIWAEQGGLMKTLLLSGNCWSLILSWIYNSAAANDEIRWSDATWWECVFLQQQKHNKDKQQG